MSFLPGTPSLFYGAEIGRGENLGIEGRLAVRSPMQGSGGFTSAAPSRLCRPVVVGPFGPEHVNVADQRTTPDSLLNFVALLIRRYRESPELGWAHTAASWRTTPRGTTGGCSRPQPLEGPARERQQFNAFQASLMRRSSTSRSMSSSRFT